MLHTDQSHLLRFRSVCVTCMVRMHFVFDPKTNVTRKKISCEPLVGGLLSKVQDLLQVPSIGRRSNLQRPSCAHVFQRMDLCSKWRRHSPIEPGACTIYFWEACLFRGAPKVDLTPSKGILATMCERMTTRGARILPSGKLQQNGLARKITRWKR